MTRLAIAVIAVFGLLAPLTGAQDISSLISMINPRDIAELTQLAMKLGAQTVESNRELMTRPGRPPVKEMTEVSPDDSPSDIFSQGLTNLMNPQTFQRLMKQNAPLKAASMDEVRNDEPELLFKAGGGVNPRPLARAAPTIEAPQVELPDGGSAATAPTKDLASSNIAKMLSNFSPKDNNGMPAITPEMQENGKQLLNLASNFLRGSGGRGRGRGSEDYGSRSGGFDDAGYGGGRSKGNNLIPNIRQLLPGARDNFGIEKGDGCLPFVNEFMQIAYGNCVKRADQRTWDAWGREFESGLTGGKINLFRASKETCRMVQEREQCGQLRRAVSECDIISSIQIAMNMQRAIERCDQVGGLIDQNPASIMSSINGLMGGEVTQGLLNNFLG